MLLSVLTATVLSISSATASVGQFEYAHTHRGEFDLGKPRPSAARAVPQVLAPDTIQNVPGSAPLELHVIRYDHGSPTPVSDLTFTITTASESIQITTNEQGIAQLPDSTRCAGRNAPAKAVTTLANSHFDVGSGSRPYQIAADVGCTGKFALIFKSDSDAGQALGIWQIAARARRMLHQSVGLDFWKSKLAFVWPDSGDYYNWGTVHLTRGDHWDVVGHEMGHGIYDLAKLGTFGGGQHKIDECYSKALALSEGWASFFSAWVSVSLKDPDAKFEYMVPRRAPIRFEQIPEDVCKGENNEWRVTGFFWDLIDLHDDGEISAEAFAKTWKALLNSRVGSTSSSLPRLQQAGFDPKTLQLIWELNFRAPLRR